MVFKFFLGLRGRDLGFFCVTFVGGGSPGGLGFRVLSLFCSRV